MSNIRFVLVSFFCLAVSYMLPPTHAADSCRTDTVHMPSFNSAAFLNHWYVYAKTSLGDSDTCDDIVFGPGKYDTMSSTYTSKSISTKEENVVKGAIDLTFFDSDVLDSVFGIIPDTVYFAEYAVLNTDYTNFAIVHVCGNNDGPGRISVLSRTSTVDATFIQSVDSSLLAYKLELSKMKVTDPNCWAPL